MERYPLYRSGERWGEVSVRREGLYFRFEAVCPPAGEGVWRLFLQGEKGELPLGVLLPEGGRLRLCRRMSCQEAEGVGAFCRGEIRTGGAEGWKELPGGALPLWRERLGRREGLRWRREGRLQYLAAPLCPESPFPLEELFCLATVTAVEGKPCVIYTFDDAQQPCLPRGRI